MIKKIFLSAFLIFFDSVAYPQVIESPKNDLKNFFKAGGDVYAAPAHFDSKDWLCFTSTLGLTTSAFLIDEDVRSFALENKGSFGDVLFKVDDFYHIEYIAASTAALYIYGTASKNAEVRNLGLKLTEAAIYAESINLLGKFLLGRQRPANAVDAAEFQPFNTSWEFTSLPSGHTTLSFAYSTVMASIYNNFLWKFGWFSLATLVGAARIYNNAHWFSDVVLGAAIGYFVGDFVNNHYTNKKEVVSDSPQNSAPNFSISFGIAF